MRRFQLVRSEDVHGVSGTGVVAEGCQFANGYCSLTWKSEFASVAVYHSIDVLEKIHGHEGRTQVRWIDNHPSQPEQESHTFDNRPLGGPCRVCERRWPDGVVCKKPG